MTCRRDTVQSTVDERTMSLKLRVPTVDTCFSSKVNVSRPLTLTLQVAGEGGCLSRAQPAFDRAICVWTSFATCTSCARASPLDTRSTYAHRNCCSSSLHPKEALVLALPV
jgi:hypothetical protein